MKRRAKIIATLGPASNDKDRIIKLLRAGMDVARINFSHGDHQGHARVIKLLRESAAELNRPVVKIRTRRRFVFRITMLLFQRFP